MAQSSFKHFYLFLFFFSTIIGTFQKIISHLCSPVITGGANGFVLKKRKPVIYWEYITKAFNELFITHSKPNSHSQHVFGLFLNYKDIKYFNYDNR